MDLSIHHVGGLWIWIHFSSPLSCSKFRESDSSPLFRVDERMIWLKISGLPICAWGLNSYKKIASLFGKFKFFEYEETSISLGRVCISTKSIKQISVTIKVEVNGELFDDNVLEIGTWNTNITDIANGILKELDNDAKNEENVFVSPKEVVPDQLIKQVEEDIIKQPEKECIKVSESSDLSRPPGFENTKNILSNNSKCSTNFARHHKKDIKGISLIHVLNKIIEVETTLGYDVRGCKKSLNRMINGLGVRKDIEGDENSKFFHEIINSKRRTQAIAGILHDGDWITEPPLIKDVFLNYYKYKFQAHDSQVIFTSIANSLILCHHDRDFLESHITLDEVKNAVWECGSNKAPGPDGFSFAIIKKYWDLMRMDIFEFVNSFFASGSMPQGANSSFFTLIPKISNPLSVKDFHPISLIGTHYKIISKLLDNRLSKRDHPVVQKEEKKMLIFKGDFEKAFDSVSWNLGFGSKWRSWIRACLHSSRASILINGSPTSEFSIKRGLRQGDPLSSFLFILVMKGIHCAISNAVNSGLIRGIKLGSSGIVLSHLFYADDVIITTDWNPHDIDNIIRVLYVFHLALGLKINIHKSNIFGIGVTNN
nr:RNA-directed DNA polymerase, eukaryota [Tanacetum cinerariifolium]